MAAFASVISASLLCATHDTCFLIIRHTLLEEVCLSCEGDVLHDYSLELSKYRKYSRKGW